MNLRRPAQIVQKPGPLDAPELGVTHTDTGRLFEVAIAPLYGALTRRLVLVLGNEHDAEDVAQDAYLAAFRAWERFDGKDVRAWLYTIALRLAFNKIRGRRRLLAAIVQVEPASWAAPSDPDLWAALGRLDGRTRAALLLNTLDGFTQAEVARILGVPDGTVASWISRGRAALRRDLDPERSLPRATRTRP